MDTIIQDLRYGVRQLARNPGFATIAVLALALGIGANGAIFSVINGVLLRPLPYPEPDRLVMIWGALPKLGLPQNWISQPELYDLQEQARAFEGMAAFATDGINLAGDGTPERLDSARVNAALFPLLGVSPSLGRTFTENEDRPGQDGVVLLSHGLWQRRFGGDPAVLGRTLMLDGTPRQIIGILPDGFRYPEPVDVWVPLALDRSNPSSRGSHAYSVLARLRRGVSLEQGRADVARIAARMAEQFPLYYPPDSGWTLRLETLRNDIVGDVRPALFVLAGAVGCVLLIACANVANLLLARATVRQREISIRTALGASRRRLARQLLTESVLLALVGGVLGVLLALWGVDLLRQLGSEELPRMSEIAIDGRVLGFSLALSLATGLVFGLAPALFGSSGDMHEVLKESGRIAGASSRRLGLRNLLVASEVALALVLLVGAGLMLESFARLTHVDPGFQTEKLIGLRISLPASQYPDDGPRISFYEQLRQRVQLLPGVQSVGLISELPLSGAYSSGTVVVEKPEPGTEIITPLGFTMLETDQRFISAGYFPALGIPLLKGRDFSDRDTADSARVAIVDESFARRFWPNQDPIGKRITNGGTPQAPNWREIVGVVGHIKHYGLDNDGREQAYFPFTQTPRLSMYLAVRTTTDPSSLIPAVRAQVSSLDGDQPIYEVSTMADLVNRSVARPRLNMMMLSLFAAVALVLAAIGIYGVISYTVSQRTREIGVRMALGAGRPDIHRWVILQVMPPVAVGLGVGLLAAFFLTRTMSSLLFDVNPSDPWTFTGIALILAAVALLASYLPARRAARVDPMVALRHE